MRKIALALTLCLALAAQARQWVHPGLLHTGGAIDRMKKYVAEKQEPALSSYNELVKATPLDYKMAGPWQRIARDGDDRGTKAGNERDFCQAYQNALLWALTADSARAVKAMDIIRAYCGTLQAITGHDKHLMAGLNGFIIINAMELMRHTYKDWTDEDTQATEDLLRRVFLPMVEDFEARSPFANGNWGAAVNKTRMAAAVYMQDNALFEHALHYYTSAHDNGALPNYVSDTGQCQESGRDQAHTQLGLSQLAEECEVAWSQGIDLWGELGNRLMKGFEYTARVNLGYEVPFTQWTDITGLYCTWDELSAKALGQWQGTYELAYNHYVGRRGLKMPYTSCALAAHVRPEGKAGGTDCAGFGSLAYYQGTDVRRRDDMPAELPKYEQKQQLYTAPQGAPLMADYRVEVKNPAGEWVEIPTYMAQANAPQDDGSHRVTDYSYCFFDFKGAANVRVTLLGGKTFQTAKARPDYRGVLVNRLCDSVASLTLWTPENISVEFDGDICHNLLIFTANPPVSKAQAMEMAKANKQKFTSLSGYVKLNRSTRLASNTMLYLEDGAYVDGQIHIADAQNVSVMGRGVVRPSDGSNSFEGIKIERSQGVTIDGVITTQCPIGESRDVTLHDVRCMTHYPWGDGLNVFASSQVTFDRCFARTSDDCTTVYATRKGYSGNARDIEMRNSTLWADVAHPIFVGLHGDSQRGDTIENVTYTNIDVLMQAEQQIDYQGCMAINSGDNNVVRGVEFDNVRIEGVRMGSILQLRVSDNPKYCTAPGGSIEDVTFRLIRYWGEQPEMSIINGYSSNRQVRGVRFQDFRVNNQPVWDDMPQKPRWYKTTDIARIYVGPYATVPTFNK